MRIIALCSILILLLVPTTGIAQEIDWVKVLTPLALGDEGELSHPSALFVEGTYHLWYVRDTDATRSICYAKSSDGVVWENYPGNPVLSDGTGADWDGAFVSQPRVLYDGMQYHMWYVGYDGTRMRIGYATSSDGAVWSKHAGNPVLDAGASGAWDDAGVSGPDVLVDGTGYHMWYSGYDGTRMRIGYATSTDGVVWQRHAANPVLNVGAGGIWDEAGVRGPSVFYDGRQYRMWYAGYDGARLSIGYATSLDGVTWDEDAQNPVLEVGANGAWDDASVSSPDVLHDGTIYRMFYTGYDGGQTSIGYAMGLVQSAMPQIDETVWVKYPAHTDLESPVSHPSALFSEDTYHLWYVREQESQRSICYAQSANGVTWETYPDNPVLSDGIGEVWDGELVSQPSVLYDGTGYHMWYSGYDGTTMQIGYATSADGVVWNRHAANPVLNVGASGVWDAEGVSSPSVLHDGTQYHMWYSGYDGTSMRIGYATSADGVVWEKHAQNPVLDVETGGAWDAEGVSSPTVLVDGTGYAMFYTGSDGDHTRIGYATSADGVLWNKQGENPVLDVGASGSFDDASVSSPIVLYDETRYCMFYTGCDRDHLKIGFAVGQESNAPPVVSLVPDLEIRVDEPFTYQVDAYDPDGDSLTYSDDTELFDIDPITGLIGVSPDSADIGSHFITVAVSDWQDTSRVSFTWTVTGVKVITTTQEIVGPAGGTVSDPSGAGVDIPAGALPAEVEISIGQVQNPPPLPEGQRGLAITYHFGPDGMQFHVPVSISIPYTQAELDALGVADPASLAVYVYDLQTRAWEEVTVQAIDRSNMVFIVEVTHFSYFRLTRPIIVAQIPECFVFALYQNYPNPFNPQTIIPYDVARASAVRLSLYALTGQRIRTLVEGEPFPGSYSVVWDGKDAAGRDVASGVYFVRMQVGNFVEARKMVVVR
jgi:predicted GH43/DUF377 family glycosyl hydrolase